MVGRVSLRASIVLAASLLLVRLCAPTVRAQAPNPAPPDTPVKLIFIHHSTGGNWLADPTDDQPSGGLGIALRDNNYYVSATNYGWGPDNIGDRTDIPNWPEWFVGPDSQRYLSALYKEKGQNIGDFGRWSRLSRDPGGENEVIVFKSCFPNSDLYGNPGDPPAAEPGGDLTVSNAKAVYNSLLPYFATRQDKLFVVITAPPLAEFDYGGGDQRPAQRAANARAFNEWLVNDWLAGYPHTNVAVFDYYNVLTSNGGDPDRNDLGQERGNHHRWRNGQIEHTRTVDNNYSSYPSGDSHPSSAGHRKATAEFVPLLNVFYHRWKDSAGAAPAPAVATGPAQPTPAPAPTEPAEPTETAASTEEAQPKATESVNSEPTAAAAPAPQGVVEDWEGENTWQCNVGGEGSTLESTVDDHTTDQGIGALRITFKLVENAWSDCGTSFDSVRDWSRADGITLALHASKAGQPLVVVLFSGDPNAYSPFVASVQTTAESMSGWTYPALPWSSFARADWADQGGPDKLDPSRIMGLAVNLTQGEGTIWLDTITLFAGQAQVTEEKAEPTEPIEEKEEPTAAPSSTEAPQAAPLPTGAPETAVAPEPATPARQRSSPCASAAAFPLALACVVLARKRR